MTDTNMQKEEAQMNGSSEPVEIKTLDEMTLKELQAHLTVLGFVGAEGLTTRKQVLDVINFINAKKLVEDNEVKPVKTSDVNEQKRYESKAARHKKFLWSQPVVPFYVPLDQGEKKGAFLPWQQNGYRLNIMKGVSVRIPEPIAKDLERMFDMTARAGEDYLMERNEKVSKALNMGGDPDSVAGQPQTLVED